MSDFKWPPEGSGGGGSGTVTEVSVATANGFSGSVSDPTTTPEITLSTTVTGLLKGNGTAISAATPGTDYQPAGNYITALTGDGTASGPGSSALTLSTVNSNVGSFTNSSITVNAKGLITAASSGSAPEVPLTFSTGLTRTVNTVTSNLSTGVSGGQTVVGGTAGGNSLTVSSTTNGTKGQIIFDSQHTWATGVGAITQILGPSDQTLAIAAQIPVQTVTAQNGNSLTISSSDAIIASGAAVGGGIGGALTLTAGDGKATTSGNATGGAVTISAGAGAISTNTCNGGALSITSGSASGTSSSIAGALTIAVGSPGAGLNSAGTTPPALNINGGTGRARTTSSSTSIGGGAVNATAGAGGQASGAGGTGGVGGTLTIQSGAGGTANASSGGIGGNSGDIVVASNAGGSATGASGTRNGGNSGNVIVRSGAVGTGASANGTPGSILFQINGATTKASIDNTGFNLLGSTSGTLTLIPAATTASYSLTFPSAQGAANSFPLNNGSGALSWRTLTAPVITKYASGSGTHSFTGSPLYIEFEIVGGGGGGGGSGTASLGNGGAGGNTTLGVSTAGGGSGATGQTGGAGGTATLGTGITGNDVTGTSGGDGGFNGTGVNQYSLSGYGGNSPLFSGGGKSTTTAAGGAGVTNTGGGGAGGGAGASSLSVAGGGGGSGAAINGFISGSTLSGLGGSISYAVGAAGTAGTAGTSGFAGGAGAAGKIIIKEYYQ